VQKRFHPDEIRATKISLGRPLWNVIKRFHPDGMKATKIPLDRLGRKGRPDLQD
jgi:hypothetical protein